MANGTVSIGFDYRKQLERACKDIEESFDKAISSKSYGKDFEKQVASFKDMLLELRESLNDSFSGISTGKLDTDKFDAFRAKVTKDFQRVDGEIDSLNKSMKALNDLLGITGDGVDLSSAINQFKELQDFIDSNNEAVTKLLKTLKNTETEVVFDAPSFSVDEAKRKLNELNDLMYNSTGKDYSLNLKSNELKKEYNTISNSIQNLIDQQFELEDKLEETDSTSPMFLKLKSEISETELKMKNLAGDMANVLSIAESKQYSWAEKTNNTFGLTTKNLFDMSNRAKETIKDLTNYIQEAQSSVAEISNKMDENTGEVKLQVKISTRDKTLLNELKEKVEKLQSQLNMNPLILPIKMVVSNARTTSENPLKSSADAIKKAQKALQDETSNVQMETDELPKQTLKQALINAERAAKESQKRIQEVFDIIPIKVHFEVLPAEIEKVSRAILDNNGETKIDISGQIDKTIQRVDTLVLKLKDVDKQVNETKTNNKFKGLSDEIKKSLTDLSSLKDILNSIKDLETTIARGMHISTNNDITKQWNKIKFWFDYISDENQSLDFTNQTKQISTLMSEYQKYVNMGGQNPLRNLTDNEETIKKLYSQYKTFSSIAKKTSQISKETSSFIDVKNAVDELTTSIGVTKVDAIEKEVDVVRNAADKEIESFKEIENEVEKLINLLSKNKKLKLFSSFNKENFQKDISTLFNGLTANIDLTPQIKAQKMSEGIAKIILDHIFSDKLMIKHGMDVKERGFVVNTKTGEYSTPYVFGDYNGFNTSMLKGYNFKPNLAYHSHSGDPYAALSSAILEYKKDNLNSKEIDKISGDIFEFYQQAIDGIDTQLIAGLDEIEVFSAKEFFSKYGDIFSNITDETKISIAKYKDDVFSQLDDVRNYSKNVLSSFLNAFTNTGKNDKPTEIPLFDIAFNDFKNPYLSAIQDDNRNKLKESFASSNIFDYLRTVDKKSINLNDEFFTYVQNILEKNSIILNEDALNIVSENIRVGLRKFLDTHGNIRLKEQASRESLEKILGISDYNSYVEHIKIEDFNDYYKNKFGSAFPNFVVEDNNAYVNIRPFFNPNEFAKEITDGLKNSFVEVNIKPIFAEEDLLNQIKYILENKETDIQKKKKKRNKNVEVVKTDNSVNMINSETMALTTVKESAEEAALAKDKFNHSNELLAVGASESANAIDNEANALSMVGKEIENIDLDKNSDEFKRAAKSAQEYFNELGEIASITKTSGTYNTYNRHTGKTEQSLRTSYRITDVNGNSRTVDPQGNLIGSKDIINVTESYRDYLKIQEEIYALNLKEAKGQQLTEEELSKRIKLLNDIKKQSDVLFDLEQKGLENAELRDEILRRNQSYEQTIISTQTQRLVGKPIEEFENKISKLNTNKNLSKQTKEYKNQLNNIVILVEKLRTYENNGITLFDSSTVNEIDEITKQINSLFSTLSDMDKAANQAKATSLISNIEDYLAKNSSLTMTSKGRGFINELRELQGELKNTALTSPELQDIVVRFNNIKTAITEAGLAGKSFFDVIKSKAFYMAAETFARLFSINDIIRYARTIFSTIKDLDTALVDLRKTAQMSASELNNFYFSSNSVAKQMGTTTKEIISQAAAWSRLGYSTADQAEKMAALSSQFAAISPGMNLDTATDGLVSSMKAFGIEVNDVERQVMDNINRIGNTMATSNQEIVDMLTRSSAAMSTANNTIQETIALESAAVEITRNAETTGTAFKTLSMRIRGYDEETEELSDDLANISGEIADLTKIDGMGGVSLFTDDTKETYKSTYQILKEISEVWDKISDKNQAALLEKLAGKRGGQVIAGVIKNFNAAEKAMNEMSNAAGSADAEMEIIQDSIEYKINAFKETWVGMAQTLIDRGDIGKIVDGFTKISEAIGFVVDKLGLLGTAGLIGGGALGFKNLGRGKTFPLFNMPSLASFNPVMGILS